MDKSTFKIVLVTAAGSFLAMAAYDMYKSKKTVVA